MESKGNRIRESKGNPKGSPKRDSCPSGGPSGGPPGGIRLSWLVCELSVLCKHFGPNFVKFCDLSVKFLIIKISSLSLTFLWWNYFLFLENPI